MQFKILAESGDERKFGQKSTPSKGAASPRGWARITPPAPASFIVRRFTRSKSCASSSKPRPTRWRPMPPIGWCRRVYGAGDKTPMAVISDIAQAAGAFVESHPSSRHEASESRAGKPLPGKWLPPSLMWWCRPASSRKSAAAAAWHSAPMACLCRPTI